MGFYSLIRYRKCFDWAYGQRDISDVDCNSFLEAEASRTLLASDGEMFCVQPE